MPEFMVFNSTEYILSNVDEFRLYYGVSMFITCCLSSLLHLFVVMIIFRLRLHGKSAVFRLMFVIELDAFFQILLFVTFSGISVFNLAVPYVIRKVLSFIMTNLLLTMSCLQVCLTYERIFAIKDAYRRVKISIVRINVMILLSCVVSSTMQSMYFTTYNDYVWYTDLLQFKKTCCDNELSLMTENIRKVGSVLEFGGNIILVSLILHHFAWIVVLTAQPVIFMLSDNRIFRFCVETFVPGAVNVIRLNRTDTASVIIRF
ncbi:unnamed protein product [Bursaphelenchus okinawaensis]|uniref:Uncharacterized protein n=1 Tax=Bursaphelenchus okinawaensis TaxID=465554 RepID=A0A811KVC2_9BILA|nr:unnamed protein product [Bursaphelenchus okinawaensis]CAG9112850.1 unnamed protein product [Bursaphelenchus okinawaensis]